MLFCASFQADHNRHDLWKLSAGLVIVSPPIIGVGSGPAALRLGNPITVYDGHGADFVAAVGQILMAVNAGWDARHRSTEREIGHGFRGHAERR